MQIEMFFESACMDYTNKDVPERYARAQAILDQDPEIIQFDIYTSSIVGDIGTVKNLLKQDPSLLLISFRLFDFEQHFVCRGHKSHMVFQNVASM